MIRGLRSILGRVVLLQVAAFATLILAIAVGDYVLIHSPAARLESRSLRGHAELIAHALAIDPRGRVTIDLPENVMGFYAARLGGYTYAVFDERGNVVLSPAGTSPPLQEHVAATPVYTQSPDEARSYLTMGVPADVDGRKLWVQVRRTVRAPGLITTDVVAHVVLDIGWIALPLALLVVLINLFVVRSVLRPVVAASRQAQAIDPRRLDLRLPTTGLPSEVVPLAETVNQALSRLEHGFRVQREFTADAAHELRTPLSVLRMRIDNLDDSKAAKTLRADVDAMGHIVEQLLAVAELDAMAIGQDETADVRQVCSDVVQLIAPVALQQGLDIELTGEDRPVLVKGNAQLLFQAVRNVVENAVRFSGKGTTVEVRVERKGLVRVLDQGPGIAEAERQLIFQRFWRRDRNRKGGVGLGLSIVARVIELHGGSVDVENRPTGGAVFSLDISHARVGAGTEGHAVREGGFGALGIASGVERLAGEAAADQEDVGG